jgi:hypothetical protein
MVQSERNVGSEYIDREEMITFSYALVYITETHRQCLWIIADTVPDGHTHGSIKRQSPYVSKPRKNVNFMKQAFVDGHCRI